MNKPKPPEKIARLGIQRDPGFLYFIDNDGDVSRTCADEAKLKDYPSPEKVRRVGLKREAGYLYFLDAAGDIARTKGSISDGK